MPAQTLIIFMNVFANLSDVTVNKDITGNKAFTGSRPIGLFTERYATRGELWCQSWLLITNAVHS